MDKMITVSRIDSRLVSILAYKSILNEGSCVLRIIRSERKTFHQSSLSFLYRFRLLKSSLSPLTPFLKVVFEKLTIWNTVAYSNPSSSLSYQLLLRFSQFLHCFVTTFLIRTTGPKRDTVGREYRLIISRRWFIIASLSLWFLFLFLFRSRLIDSHWIRLIEYCNRERYRSIDTVLHSLSLLILLIFLSLFDIVHFSFESLSVLFLGFASTDLVCFLRNSPAMLSKTRLLNWEWIFLPPKWGGIVTTRNEKKKMEWGNEGKGKRGEGGREIWKWRECEEWRMDNQIKFANRQDSTLIF